VLLVAGLFGGWKSGHLNPAQVVHEIQILEGTGIQSRLKPPAQFKRPPLKGLWHKHYLPDGRRATAINIVRASDKYGIPRFEKHVREAQESGEERFVSIDDVEPIIHDVVCGNWDRLSDDAALTGEWLVYAKNEGKNYYLCLGTHERSWHKNLREQIDKLCCLEFPFLSALLSSV